jgi:hypothetical protein
MPVFINPDMTGAISYSIRYVKTTAVKALMGEVLTSG